MPIKKVLVLGGNLAGLTAALTRKHKLENEADFTVVSKSGRSICSTRSGIFPLETSTVRQPKLRAWAGAFGNEFLFFGSGARPAAHGPSHP